MTGSPLGNDHDPCNAAHNEEFGLWWSPFGVYVWSDRLRFRFSWGPYFVGGWRPSFRRLPLRKPV